MCWLTLCQLEDVLLSVDDAQATLLCHLSYVPCMVPTILLQHLHTKRDLSWELPLDVEACDVYYVLVKIFPFVSKCSKKHLNHRQNLESIWKVFALMCRLVVCLECSSITLVLVPKVSLERLHHRHSSEFSQLSVWD